MSRRKYPKLVEKKLQSQLSAKERKAGYFLYGLSEGATDGVIELDPRQSERERLDTLVHECIHQIEGLLPNEINHDLIFKAGEVVSQVLWRDGWRRVRLK